MLEIEGERQIAHENTLLGIKEMQGHVLVQEGRTYLGSEEMGDHVWIGGEVDKDLDGLHAEGVRADIETFIQCLYDLCVGLLESVHHRQVGQCLQRAQLH